MAVKNRTKSSREEVSNGRPNRRRRVKVEQVVEEAPKPKRRKNWSRQRQVEDVGTRQGEFVGLKEIADMIGYSRQRTGQFVDMAEFPQCVVALSQGRVWLRSDVEDWVDEFFDEDESEDEEED